MTVNILALVIMVFIIGLVVGFGAGVVLMALSSDVDREDELRGHE